MKIYNLTNPQNSIWQMEQYYKGTNINNICGALVIKQNIDLDILNKAVNIFIQNNRSFGLNFKEENGNLVQFFTDIEDENYEKVNLQDYSAVQVLAKEITEEVFDIYDKKLYKFVLFKLKNGHGGFIVLTHHIISDAATFGLIGTEVVENYRKILANEKIAKKDYSYEEYIQNEQEYIKSNKFKKDEEYWNNLYSDVPEVAMIPSMKSKSNIDLIIKAKRKEYLLGTTLCKQISDFCKENKISNFNFFMAVYAIYLSKISNLKDFVIGTPILNRTNFNEKHTTGMFISTVPSRIRLDSTISFIDFTKQIAKDSLSMLRYQKYPYEMLLENLRKESSNLPNLYDVMLSYQITKAYDKNIQIPYEVEWFGTTAISNSISIHLHDNNDEGNLNISYDYQIQKYDENNINEMHNRILHIINQVLENKNIIEKDIEIVTKDEKYKILNEFNDTKTDYPKNKTIIQLFEEQVTKTPDNIAVVFEDKKFTYKELNEKANQFGNYLIKNNIKSRDIVGIMLHRSPEMIISILAILKIGAAYLPIDPEYPIDRINYMLSDSNTKTVLVHSLTEGLSFDADCAKIKVDLDTFNMLECQNINCSINQSDLFYLIYTSGSTR